jgi:hypothetical protein
VELPLLQRREIEARILAPVIAALAERFGRDEVHELVAATVRDLARRHGADLARDLGGNTLRQLAEVLDVWTQDEALDIRMVRRDERNLDFDVTRCRFAEMYQRLGIPELGPILSCNRDFCFAEGFNESIRLTRKQTIMEGADHCDFRFRGEEAEKQKAKKQE